MNCHICDKSTKMFVDEKTDIDYYHCNNCECIFKSPIYYQDLNTQKNRYDLHENSNDSEGYKSYFYRFLDFVLPLISMPKKALDFGCGESKLLSNILNDMKIDTYVYDPIYYSNSASLNQKYQLIVSVEVFEHLHHPKKIFEQLLNMLETDGYMAIQTQFHTNNIEEFKKWYYHQDPTHIVFYTEKTFKILCDIYHCKIVAHNDKNIMIIQRSR